MDPRSFLTELGSCLHDIGSRTPRAEVNPALAYPEWIVASLCNSLENHTVNSAAKPTLITPFGVRATSNLGSAVTFPTEDLVTVAVLAGVSYSKPS
jgi:hypothetical protein